MQVPPCPLATYPIPPHLTQVCLDYTILLLTFCSPIDFASSVILANIPEMFFNCHRSFEAIFRILGTLKNKIGIFVEESKILNSLCCPLQVQKCQSFVDSNFTLITLKNVTKTQSNQLLSSCLSANPHNKGWRLPFQQGHSQAPSRIQHKNTKTMRDQIVTLNRNHRIIPI